MNSLKHFIKTRYGNVSSCGRNLGVSPQAVGTWITRSPRNILRYMPEVCVQCQVTPQYLLNVVMNTEAELIQTAHGTKPLPDASAPDHYEE